MVEAAGQLFRLFRAGLDYAFIRSIRMRGVLSKSPHPNPLPQAGEGMSSSGILVSAQPCRDQRIYESLQGRPEIGSLPTPRRYRVPPLPAPSGFTDVSPVFTPPSRAEATQVDRTRVRKSYATGPTCLAASIILAARYPKGREDVQPAQVTFSKPAFSTPDPRACERVP